MAPKGKQAKIPAETPAKTIWFLLVDHEGQLSFGDRTQIAVQADTNVDDLKEMIKEKQRDDLGPFEASDLEVWTYKHEDISLKPKLGKLREIVGGIKFLEDSKNPDLLPPNKNVTEIDLAEDVILLVRVPPPQTTDTATAGGKGSEYSYVLLQLIMSDKRAARNWRCSLIGAFPRVPSHIHQCGKLGRLPGR
jgi:hypothetical protein